ncbi:MAG: efflux RND transporter periplasmic adaptor subunit [Planctomycetaceae bacterium]
MSSATEPSSTSRPNSESSSDLRERVKSLRLSSIPPGENMGRKFVSWVLGIVLLITFVLGAGATFRWLFSPKAKPEVSAASTDSSEATAKPSTTAAVSAPSSTPVERPQPAGTVGIKAEKGAIAYESKGYIVPAHQILVSPKVGGMIVSLNVEEGRRVTKGDVLAMLESTDYKADLDRSQAVVRLARERLRELETGNRPEEIHQAEEELAEAEAQLVQSDQQYRRDQDLKRRNNELVTDKELEESESRFRMQQKKVSRLGFALALMKLGPREERLAAARAELDQAIAEAAKAEWRYGNCTIRAPISGTILKKNAEEGNIVNPGAFNGSFSLCDLADLSDLEVDLSIQERDISRVFVGQKCSLSVDAYPNRFYEGYVSRLMPIADRAKGAVPVRVKVIVPAEEEGVYLKPEMGAVVRFLKEEEGTASPVPASSAPVAPPAAAPAVESTESARSEAPESEPEAAATEAREEAAVAPVPATSKPRLSVPGGTTRE